MCSGDTLKYKTVNAATYEKKGSQRPAVVFYEE